MGAPVTLVALSNASVGSLLWQRPPNAPVLTVVCRATFVLAPGDAVLAAEQEPLADAERPYPDGSSRGLYTPRDLVPMKPRADVVLVGHAFAPGRQPVRSLVARLAVGEVDKCVEVFCDRHFDMQGTLHEGAPFASMPLVYERAAGGPDTQNPIGVRPDARDRYGRLAVPNLQPMGVHVVTPEDPIAPAGFGPIASTWPTRRALSVAAVAEWQEPYLPADLDPAHFHAAPRDQQMQALRSDERIVLGNLHPQHPELVIRLSGIRPRTFVESLGAAPQETAMRADTLWFDTSRQVFSITWRGQLPLKPSQSGLRVLIALDYPDHPLGWDDVERLARLVAPRPPSSSPVAESSATQTMTVLGPKDPPAPALPFMAVARTAPAPREPSVGGGLPFRRPGDAPPPPLPAPPVPREDTVDEAGPQTVPTRAPPVTAPTVPAMAPAAPAATESPWARGGSPAHGAPPAMAHDGGSTPPAQPLADVSPPVAKPAPAPKPSTPTPAPPLHLAWFEPSRLSVLRRDPRFSPILDALEERPLDGDLDDPTEAADVADVDERREVFEILARGGPIGEEGVTAALAGAVRDDGRLVQPLVLVAGELAFAFDELEALKALMSAAAPYAGVDLEAKAILDLARDLLGAPGQPPAPSVAEGVATRIRETFEKRALVPAGFLDAQAGRALLAGRCHQARALLGGPHVRALLHTGAGQPIPVYLDADAAAKLPAADRIRTRMLATVHPTLDQQETHPAALSAVALGVVVAPLARR